MAQRKKDGALIDQLKEMVLSLQEQNADQVEALEECLRFFKKHSFVTRLTIDGHAKKAVLKTQAAIAKAKGGAP